MKPLAKILPIIAVLLFLTACGGQEQAPEIAAAPPTIRPTTTDTPAPTPTQAPAQPTETLPAPVVQSNEAEAVPEPTPVPPTPEPTPVPIKKVWDRTQFGYGAQSHAVIGDPAYAMDVISGQLKLDWVKVQLRWADLEVAPGQIDWWIWDIIINEAAQKDNFLMLSIVTSPNWSRAAGDQHGPPDDRQLYYNFLTTLINRYPDRIHAIEVWNEQNLDREWQTENGVAPGDYVDFLKGAYQTIKTADPDIIVISGALAPTGFHDENKRIAMNDLIWTDEALSLGMLDHLDCVGVHHNGYNIPPDIAYDKVSEYSTADGVNFKGPWDNPHPSWSFFSTLQAMTEKVQAIDASKKICVTEFGWASSEGYDEYPEGFEFAQDNTLEEQAQFITQAFTQMRDSGDVMLAFLFNFDYGNKGGGPTDDNVAYSIIDTNGAPRPAFGAIADLEK